VATAAGASYFGALVCGIRALDGPVLRPPAAFQGLARKLGVAPGPGKPAQCGSLDLWLSHRLPDGRANYRPSDCFKASGLKNPHKLTIILP
jgi:hypothetical protein